MSTGLRIGLVAACAAAGCLPAGDAPRGQHLLDGREDLFVMFQWTIPGTPSRLLLLSDTPDPISNSGVQGFSVYDIAAPDPSTGRSQKSLLADNVLYGDSGCENCTYAFDARGRLLLPQQLSQFATGSLDIHLSRVDVATAARVDLGPVDQSSQSADRTLLLLMNGSSGRVRDLDDHETLLPEILHAEMVGNDVYFVSVDEKLFRLRGTALTAAPELAAEDVASFQRVDTATGPLLVLSRPTTDVYVPTNHALFDPASFAAMPLPGESGPTSNVTVTPSPTGKLLLIAAVDSGKPQQVTLFDRESGTARTETVDEYVFNSHWRPGHDEVWLEQQGGLLRWRAGEAPAAVADAVTAASAVRPSNSIFTPDGRSWLSYARPPAAEVRSADDPAAEGLTLNSPGTQLLDYWALPDGRGVAETFTTYQMHADLSLVDPAAGTSSLVGSDGYVVAIGAHRALAYLHWVKSTSSGTLTLIDLGTGAQTVLGENVHGLTLDASPDAGDRLAPGTRVAFLVRHRIAGPYDGLWMAILQVIAAGVYAALLALAPDAGAADAPAPDAAIADGRAAEATPAPDAGAADTLAAAPVPARPRGRLDLRVFGLGSRKPVAGAALTIDVDEVGETDRQGRLSADVPCGPRHVAIQVPGFEPLSIVHDACADRDPVVVRLAPRSGAAAYETVVRAPTTRQSVRLEGDEVTHTPGTLGDPFRAIESLPGVTAVAWPAPIYAVRGANPGNTGFMLDDLRVPALFHFALGPSVIHPYFFEGLDFYPGGYPARYGRYVAGLVSARTRLAPEDDVHGSVDVRLFDAGAILTAPLPRGGSISVAGRYSYTGAVIDYLSSEVSLAYWDYQLRADRPAGPFQLTLLAFGSSDSLTTDTGTSNIALNFHRVKLRAELPIGRGRLSAALGAGLDHSESPLSGFNNFRLDIDARTLLPRVAYAHPWQHADLEVGLDGELTHYQPLRSLAALNPTGPLDLGRERTARLLGAYASVVVRAGPRLLLTPELRADGYDIGTARRADVGPRLSARLALDDRTWLRATSGRFSQPPSLPLQIPGLDNFGLAVYGLQTSWQGALTAGTTRLAGLEVELTGFVQRYVLTDIRDPIPSRSNDPFADDFLVRRDALSTGVELLVRRPATERLHGWLAYTLSDNKRALGGGVIGPSDWDQRHVLNLVLGYRFGRTTVGGRAHLNTGRPVLVEAADGEQFQRLPAFYQVDLRVDRRVLFQKFRMDVYLELVNATLSRQVVGLSADYMGGTRPDSFRIVLPSIGIHAEL